MSGRRAKSPKLELKLNLSPPRADDDHYHLQTKESPNSSTSSPSSCESSCVSSASTGLEENNSSAVGYRGNDPRPQAATSMVVVGCPQCLMYVMLSEVDPKCPRCKSSVLLDFVNRDNLSTKKKNGI